MSEKEFRKVTSPTKGQIRQLLAEGWEYVGPLDSAPEVHRFQREIVAGQSDDDVVLDPQGVLTFIQLRLRGE